MREFILKIARKLGLTKIYRFLERIKDRGIKKSILFFRYKLITFSPILKIRQKGVNSKLDDIIKKSEDKPIILSLSFIDWSVPLYQRPQHIAIQLAKQGFLYFYNTRNYYDFMDGYKHIGENMYLTNRFDDVLERVNSKKKYIHLYSTNMYEEDDERIERALKKGFKIIYEYIDEISEKISGKKIPKFVLDRHERLLRDEDNVIVIATATKLYNDVAKYRKKNFKLVTNGVVYEHFRDIENIIPKEMEEAVSQKKPIIGYYGALASWFDYDLVKAIAKMRKDWNIVLIGWDYDGSLSKSGLNDISNIHFISSVPYEKLPTYAQWFDICTIPFKINEVTLSTSPVKLFEYMALGKPIVTTAMPECKKYRSVIIAENNTKDFIKKIEVGLKLKDDTKYKELLKKEALENTWEKKAEDMIKIMKSK